MGGGLGQSGLGRAGLEEWLVGTSVQGIESAFGHLAPEPSTFDADALRAALRFRLEYWFGRMNGHGRTDGVAPDSSLPCLPSFLPAPLVIYAGYGRFTTHEWLQVA